MNGLGSVSLLLGGCHLCQIHHPVRLHSHGPSMGHVSRDCQNDKRHMLDAAHDARESRLVQSVQPGEAAQGDVCLVPGKSQGGENGGLLAKLEHAC